MKKKHFTCIKDSMMVMEMTLGIGRAVFFVSAECWDQGPFNSRHGSHATTPQHTPTHGMSSADDGMDDCTAGRSFFFDRMRLFHVWFGPRLLLECCWSRRAPWVRRTRLSSVDEAVGGDSVAMYIHPPKITREGILPVGLAECEAGYAW